MRLSPPLRSPFLRVALLWIALALLTACSDSAAPEQQVRAVIESMEVAAEARDVGELMEHISANYRDAQGQDRAEASRSARGYFVANQSVHLLTRIESLEFPSPDEARVKLQVGMAGRAGEPGATGLTADLYDFDLVLVREGDEWQVSYVDWRAH
jgi:outer membrane biogenesis lipoprotein LolB